MDPGVHRDRQRVERAMEGAGQLLRQLRKEAELSLAGLAERSGLSQGLLSQMERGRGNPSVTTLIKLSQALGVPLIRFFEGLDEEGALVRANARPRLETGSAGIQYELMTPHMHGRLGIVRAVLEPGWSNADAPFRHVGEECLMLLEGDLVAIVNGVEYPLAAGDSLTYDSSQPHWYRNESTRPAVTLGAMTPPSF